MKIKYLEWNVISGEFQRGNVDPIISLPGWGYAGGWPWLLLALGQKINWAAAMEGVDTLLEESTMLGLGTLSCQGKRGGQDGPLGS